VLHIIMIYLLMISDVNAEPIATVQQLALPVFVESANLDDACFSCKLL